MTESTNNPDGSSTPSEAAGQTNQPSQGAAGAPAPSSAPEPTLTPAGPAATAGTARPTGPATPAGTAAQTGSAGPAGPAAPIPPTYNYATQQPVAPGQAQPQRKVWPWVLLACLLAFLLGLGGCAGCTAVGLLIGNAPQTRDGSLHQYDYDESPFGYNYNYDDGSSSSSSDSYGGFTIDDIASAAGTLPNDVDEGKASAGVYVVGRDIDAGNYFMQGMTSQEGNFYVFSPEGSGTFSLQASIVYIGHYFYELEDGQVIVFKPSGNDLRMIPADEADFSPQAPYTSGLYRVGEDIPAGAYTITVSDDAPRDATQEYAAYIMQDLKFDDDSILDTKYLIKGSKQTIDVEEGQLLELFGCTATPTD